MDNEDNENNEDCSLNKKCKIFIIFDDMIVDMLTKKTSTYSNIIIY